MEVVDEAEGGPIELRFTAEGSGFNVWAGDLLLAAVSARADHQSLTVDVRAEGHCDRHVAECILTAVEALATHPGALVDSANPIVRDQARRRGYAGPLRGPLTTGLHSGQAVRPVAPDRMEMADSIGVLLDRLVTADSAGTTRRLFNVLRFGYGDVLRLAVGTPPLTVTVPDSPDVMVETVAAAIDTVLAVRDRFGPHAEHLSVVSFDRASHHRGQQVRWAGHANHMVFSIHINDSLALADGWLHLRRQRETAPLRRPPAIVRHPFTAIDGVVAHEAWHQIDFGFRGRLADQMAFRRELGAVLGVQTLEQAILGGHPNAPDASRLAHERLTETVSAYAATNPLEATAEMFKLWWCGTSNPTIDRFGELLDRFFGVGAR